MKTYLSSILVLASLFLAACGSEGKEILIEEEQAVEIISHLFLSEYGGVEAEREHFCGAFNSFGASCNEHQEVPLAMVQGEKYEWSWGGAYHYKCEEDWADYEFKKRHQFSTSPSSSGFTNSQDFHLSYDMESEIRVFFSEISEAYNSSIRAARNFEIEKAPYWQETLPGRFSVFGDLCVIDYPNTNFKQNAYSRFDLEIRNPEGNKPLIELRGAINYKNGSWTLTIDDGNSYVLAPEG